MVDEAPEDGGFEFRLGFVVDRHGSLSSRCRIWVISGPCHRFRHIPLQALGIVVISAAGRMKKRR
jgi:hypothetical protein